MRIFMLSFALAAVLFSAPVFAYDGCFVGGDSISLGQKDEIFAAFPGRVTRNPGNGRDTWHWLENVTTWFASDKQYRTIYFDVGLWDIAHRCPTAESQWALCPQPAPFAASITTGPSQFNNNLTGLINLIKVLQPQATIILASITPVPDDSPGRLTTDGVKYNSIMTHVTTDEGVEMDHLSTIIGTGYHKTATNVHYTDAGYHILAAHVIDVLNAHGGC